MILQQTTKMISFHKFITIATSLFFVGSALGITNGELVYVNNPMSAFTVRITNQSGRTFCTGVLLAPTIVLTAAHCKDLVQDGDLSFERPLYISGTSYQEGGSAVHAQYFAHENYNKNDNVKRAYDVAILVLDSPRVFFPVPVTLWQGNLESLSGSMVETYGYGRIDRKESQSEKQNLRRLKKEIIKVQDLVFDFDQTDERGICPGDSGGPVILNVNGKFEIVGINHRINFPFRPSSIPFAVEDCFQTSSLVRIDKVRPWIEKMLTQLQ